MIRSKLHFLKHPCPLSLWSLASWTFLLSQNHCYTDHFAVGFCDLGADRFYGLCSAIRVKSLKGKMQIQHCDPHSKAYELNCGRPSETMNKMGHLDRIQITQNLKQKREVVFHRATEWRGVGSEPHQSNQNSFLSELLYNMLCLNVTIQLKKNGSMLRAPSFLPRHLEFSNLKNPSRLHRWRWRTMVRNCGSLWFYLSPKTMLFLLVLV